MKLSPKLTADEIRDIVAAYQAGKSIRAIATRYRRAYGTIHRTLHTAGVTMRPRGHRSTRTAAEDLA